MEEAQTPEEVVEAVEEVATLEAEETTEAETQEDTLEASTESTTDTTAEDNKSGYERRQKFKAQKAELTETKQELQHLKEQMYRNQQAQQPAQPTTPLQQQVQGDPNAPNIDNYEDTNLYIRDVIKYEGNVKDQQRKSQSQVDKFNELEQAYKLNNKSYEDDIAYTKSVQPNSNIAQEFLRSDYGPQLLQAYSRDPELAIRLNSLDASSAIREIIKLEEKVKITPAVSSAPAPISTSKTSMPTGSKKYSEGQSQRDYATEREAYIASKRR